MFLGVLLTIWRQWFKLWLATEQAASYYLKRYWYVLLGPTFNCQVGSKQGQYHKAKAEVILRQREPASQCRLEINFEISN